MKTNTKPVHAPVKTFTGSPAARINTHQQLRRSVMSCLLWEKEFYEDGVSIAQRIEDLVSQSDPEFVANLAIEAREKMNLRHIPLFLCRILAKNGTLKADTLSRVIQRADELSEFVSLYWKDGKQPLSRQVKLGLASAFTKFNEYHLAKYNRDSAIKLRDVLFLCHAKPKDVDQEVLWKKLIDKKLETPETWEVLLSSGKDKKETFEKLISEKKLGYLATLRNLRNMEQAGVDESLVNQAILDKKGAKRVLPFRYVAAAKHAPKFEPALDQAMLSNLSDRPKLPGKTVVVIDVSGSMYGSNLSDKSDMNRAYVASTLATFLREICENPVIYATAGNDRTKIHQTQLVPARRGMALVDAIYQLSGPLGGGGIFLTPVCNWISGQEKDVDRMIVITDEQDCSGDGENSPLKAVPLGKNNYLINVASAKNGIGYGKWTHIDGWSESVVDYIYALENISSSDNQSDSLQEVD